MSLPLDMSMTPMGAAYRRAKQGRCMLAMSYAGREMADWQVQQVQALRYGQITAEAYLKQATDVFEQLYAAIHFMAETCRLCHHDIKMFNVAIDKHEDGSLKASLFDFGTTFP